MTDVVVEDPHLGRRVEQQAGATDECNSPALGELDRTILSAQRLSLTYRKAPTAYAITIREVVPGPEAMIDRSTAGRSGSGKRSQRTSALSPSRPGRLTAEKDLVLAWCWKGSGLSSIPVENHRLRSRTSMVRVGILTVSDRASRGEYEDVSGPAIESWLGRAITSAWTPVRRIVPDGLEPVRNALIAFCDDEGADLVLTTGGTGPAPRDLTPEAMRAVTERELPGFGELMRRFSLETVPTAILSRQSAGVRGRTLIVNLPGKPASIAVCLDAVFPAVPYCLDLIGASRIETDPAVCQAFRPA